MPDIRTLGSIMALATAPYQEPQNSVRSRAVGAPPPSAADGDRYIVPVSALGGWAGHDLQIAQWVEGAWRFLQPTEGTTLWIDDEDAQFTFDGASWIPAELERWRYVADEPLSALRAARLASPGHVVYARPPEVEAQAPIGITAKAAASGETLPLIKHGELQDPSWSWIPGQPILLGALGALTQSAPDGVPYLVVLGMAIAPDLMIVRIESPTYL